jgi:hypothetical protein
VCSEYTTVRFSTESIDSSIQFSTPFQWRWFLQNGFAEGVPREPRDQIELQRVSLWTRSMIFYNELIKPNQKTPYALWFEFYRLCLNDPEHREALERSKEFYEPWGDVRSISFRDWWAGHRHLFNELEVKEVGRGTHRPGTIVLQIPLGEPTSVTLPQIKKLIEDRQRARLERLGLDPSNRKSLKVGFTRYALTDGVELRVDVLIDAYIVYRFWLHEGKPKRITQDFCEFVYMFTGALKGLRRPIQFLGRGGFERADGTLQFDKEQIHQLRRLVDRGRKIARAVAGGQFPGRP